MTYYGLSVFISILLGYIGWITICGAIGTGYAQTGQINTTHYFGCQPGEFIDCQPLLKKFDSFEIKNISAPVYNSDNYEPALVSGKLGSAVKMTASHLESIEIFNHRDLNPNNFSVSFWIKSVIDPEFHGGDVLSHIAKNPTAGWFFNALPIGAGSESGQSLRFVVVNTERSIFSTDEVHVSSDEFTHVAATFDGIYLRIYENGVLLGKTRFNGTYNSDPHIPLRIGGSAFGLTSNLWSGIIDDFRFYNRSLSDSQIKELIYDNNDDANSNKSLIGHWSFNDDVKDVSGNNHHGRLMTIISSMVFAPDGRLFFSEKNTGNIMVMKNDKVLDKPFVSLSDHYINWEQGLLGLAMDPNFVTNHYIYLYYTSIDNKTLNPYNKVVRFTEYDNKSMAMKVIVDKIPASKGYHSGGALAFGKDDKLYITVGDAADPYSTVQQNSSSLLGKVLRINRDGSIPHDNPIPGSPVYNIGHRNMYGIAFDNYGNGIVTENGANFYDEINSVAKGGNYGYPLFQRPDEPPELSHSSLKPLRSYWSVIAPTQAIFYQGIHIPELKGKFLFGTNTGQIYALRLSNNGKELLEEDRIQLKHSPFSPVISLAESPTGEVYYGGYGIHKLERVITNDKKLILFPIEVTSPSNIVVSHIKLIPADKKIIVSLEPYRTTKDIEIVSLSSPPITLKIPKSIMEEISLVSATGKKGDKGLDFSISKEKDYYNLIVEGTSNNYRVIAENIKNSTIKSNEKLDIYTRNDTKSPVVNITSPPYPPPTLPSSIPTKTVMVNGTASDTDSGVQKIEAFVHTFPFDNKFPFIMATSTSPGNWSKWSIPLHIADSGVHRIVVQATDYAGNQYWDDVIVNIPSNPFTLDKVTIDNKPPVVNITSPPYPPTLPSSIPTKTIMVNGTASDTDSGVQKIAGYIDRFPFTEDIQNNESVVIPVSPGNWSNWSIPLHIADSGFYRLAICARDYAENQYCDELTINIPSNGTDSKNIRVAFVDPVFTSTAYNGNNGSAFYDFYFKYSSEPTGVKITDNLHLVKNIPILTREDVDIKATTIPNAILSTFYKIERDYIKPFVDHVQKFGEVGSVTILRDEDIHEGHIFTDDGKNAYDTIFLLHQEYMTQKGYDNLKWFVWNGGIIVFIDGNILYAEILYNENEHTISLLEGHDWKIGGEFATKGVAERWFQENKDWIGSNYLVNDIKDNVYFKNNPFNYTHFEENYITNPNVTVLLDYDVEFGEGYPYPGHKDAKIGTYQMDYGNGKILMVGIYGQNMAKNKEFLRFFDNEILPRTVGNRTK